MQNEKNAQNGLLEKHMISQKNVPLSSIMVYK